MYFLLQHVYEICWHIRLGAAGYGILYFVAVVEMEVGGSPAQEVGGGQRHGELIRSSTDCQHQSSTPAG